MSDTPNLALPCLEAAQAQKHVTHNEALLRLDALVQMSVIDRDLAVPPGSPADGDRYLVAAGATGAWAGWDLGIAWYVDGGWIRLVPQQGWRAWVADEGIVTIYGSGAWNDLLQDVPLLGIGTTADATNPLSAKLNNALFAARTAGEGGDGDLRFKLNKEAAGNFASCLFQTNWSGRAEFGLIGNDDFTLKVSADGSAWKEVIVADRETGLVTFPSGVVAASGHFSKADYDTVAFTKTGAGTIDLKAGTRVELAGIVYSFAAPETVQMPSLTAGTDYAIYICGDGTVRADANFSSPGGFDTSTSRKIGGFHYAPGANATAQAGGGTTPDINEYSLWDLKWRPACEDPRGMTLVANRFWCDIYLLGVNHHANGTSCHDVTIADSVSPPKIPAEFGGNGAAAYSSLTWWEAAEVMAAHGKHLPDYGQFAAAAYGVTENAARGNDPVTTGLGTTNSGSSNMDEKFTSKWGVIQASGVVWIWSNQFGGPDAGAGWANTNGGRGQVYQQSNAALLGASWSAGAYGGSRASHWYNAPSTSGANIGARGCCDHLRLA